MRGFGTAAAVGGGGDVLRLAREDGRGGGHGHGGHPSHMSKNMGASRSDEEDFDPSAILAFFRLHDVKLGRKLPLYFPHIDEKMAFNFLPKEQADSIPFSSKDLPKLLKLFSISPGSPQGRAMKETLWSCEAEPVPGENPHCATSLQSLLGFAHTILGPQLQMQKTSPTTSVLFLHYTVLKQPRKSTLPS